MLTTDGKVEYAPRQVLEVPGRTQEDGPVEAAQEAFKLLEGRWKMVILFHLFDKGRMRFSELERAIPLVSQKMLIQQLRDLEAKGLVGRKVFQEVPPRVEYCLTEVGMGLRPALQALVEWAMFRRQVPVGHSC